MSSTKVYPCQGCGKRMKSRGGLTRHMNSCMSQIIQQIAPTRMQPKQDMPIPGEDDNSSDNFRLYEDEGCTPEAQNIERDHRNSVGKSSDTRSRARVRHTPQDGLLGSELSLSLSEVRFIEQEFSAGTPVFNIKYDYPRSQNHNLFYPFHN